jgi:hypothetical protein
MKKVTLFLFVLLLGLALAPAVLAQPTSYDSGFQVQNLSDTDAATVSIRYVNQNGSENVPPVSDTIAAGSSTTYFPIDANAGFNGSVVISSDQPVAAIANILANGLAFGASYDSFSVGSAEVNLPLIMKANSGFNTWFNVQNTNESGDVTVNVAYAGTTCTETGTIAPGAAQTFEQSTNACLPAGYVGAAIVTATGGEVVATVMETGTTTLFAYNGFTGGSPEPVIPLVNANNSGFITGIQVQNTGAASTDVTVAFTPSAGAPGTACEETKTVAAGESATFALYSFSLNGDPDPGTEDCTFGETFIGSASVSQSGTENLVGIVNQLSLGANKASSYNAFDPAAASANVLMPLIMDRNSGFYTGINVINVGSASPVTCTYTSNDGSVSQSVTSPSLPTGGSFNHLQLNFLANGFVGSGVCTADSAGGSIIGVVNELGNTSGDVLFTYEGFNN